MTISRGIFLFCGSIVALLIAARAGFGFDTYPWLFPDSYDWLTNGLAYSGLVPSLEISHRALLLPLLTSVLLRFGLESVVPLIGTFAFAGLLWITFRILALTVSREIGVITTILLACSSPLLFQSGFVGSDVLAVLCLTGLNLSYLRYLVSHQRTPLVCAALWAALGIHSQYIGVIWIPFLLIGLGLDSRPTGIRYSLARFKTRAFSIDMGIACLTGLAAAVIILIPRMATYGVVYAPHVVHLPLVSPSARNVIPYLVGFTGQLSWPFVMISLIGSWRGFRRTETQLVTLLSTAWVAVIGGFFVIFYSWFDIRFVIYITVPVAILAAIGIGELSRTLQLRLRKQSPALQICMTTAFAMAICGTELLRPNPDVFSGELLLTPRHAVTVTADGDARFRKLPAPDVSVIQVLRESDSARSLEHNDTLMHAPRLRKVFQSLPHDGDPITFIQELRPDETYYVRNRNILYRTANVVTVPSIAEGIQRIRESTSGIIVTDRTTIDRITTDLPAETVLIRTDPYVAVRTEVARARLRSFPPEITSVTAAENPHAIFDGIANRADNYTAAPLEQAIRITFARPRSIAKLTIQLYDFDARKYRLTVQVPSGSWYASAPSGDSGVVEVSTPSDPAPYIDIVGHSNSDTEQNPANRVFHIKEMQIVYRD